MEIKQLPLLDGSMVECFVESVPAGWGRECGGKYTVYEPKNKKQNPEKPLCGLTLARSSFGLGGFCSETDFARDLRDKDLIKEDTPKCPVLELRELQKDPDDAWAARGLKQRIEEWYDAAQQDTRDSRTLSLKEE